MVAKIKTKTGTYTSIVFGFLRNKWKTKAIVLNEDYTALNIIKFWNPKRAVFVFDNDRTGWVENGEFEGYDWIYDKLSTKLFKQKISYAEIIDRCKEMQEKVKDVEWRVIENNKDIDDLDAAAINFHDACVNKLFKENDKLIIEFDAWDCRIVLELEGDIETNLYINCGNSVTADGFWDGIFCSKMFFENGFIYWVNVDDITKSEEIFEDDFNRYFKCKNVRWKIIV